MAVRPDSMFDKFTEIMNAPPFDKMGGVSYLAVAVSGGPDSMALARLLCDWSAKIDGPDIHIITVDHGLRAEAAQEAENVARITKDWPKARHVTLVWEGQKPQARIQEEARKARYSLIEQYCSYHSIQHLFLAHHGDDQVETFLFRLSKGSGLDGLCGMKPVQERGSLLLCRPLLNEHKDDLISFCEDKKIEFMDDPSNDKDEFSRVRLRKMIAALEEEGLSIKRISKTAERLERARQSLAHQAVEISAKTNTIKETNRIVFNFIMLKMQGVEIVLRVIKMAIDDLIENDGYGPRTEKLEDLVEDLLSQNSFRKRSLGGVIFEVSKDGRELILQKENIAA